MSFETHFLNSLLNLPVLRKALILSIFLLFFLPSAGSQTDILQLRLDLNKNEWTLGDLFKEIQQQTGLDLSYSSSRLDLSKTITLPAGKLTLGQCFGHLDTFASVKAVHQGKKILFVNNYIAGKSTSENGSISGFVRDALTGEKMIGAHIFLQQGENGTNTDLNGYFYIGWKGVASDCQITISYVGYKDLNMIISGNTHLQSDFYLHPGANFAPVIIYENYSSSEESSYNEEWTSASQSKLQYVPGSFGGVDIFREIALLPGVIKTTDLQSGVSIRGFGSAQTNYLIDGIHLYEPNHSFGLFSVFNHHAVNHVEIFKHDIPFSLAGRLSGVVNHELKNGDIHQWQSNIGLNTAAMDLTLQGPLIKGKTSLMISGRKSLIDTWLPAVAHNFRQYQAPSVDFHDLNFKITHQINPLHKIEIMTLQYRDRVFFRYLSDNRILSNRVEWGSNLGGIRWNGVFGNRMSMSSQFAWSNFSNYKNAKMRVLLTSVDTVGVNILGQSQIKDIIWHNQLKYHFSNQLQLNSGLKLTFSRLRPSLYRRINFEIDDLSGFLEAGKDSLLFSIDTYADVDYILTDELKMGGGIQVNTSKSKANGTVLSINPVFRLFYKPARQHHFHLSIQKLTQSHHLLLQNTYGLSSDFWLPLSPLLPIEKLWQFALDYGLELNRQWNYQSGFYYRNAGGLPAFKKPGDQYDPVLERGSFLPVFTDSGNWKDKVISHEASSIGVEQELRWKWKQLSLILAYTLGKTDYTEKHSGITESYPGDFDVRHAANIFLKYSPGSGINSYISWQYHSGRPFSLPVDAYKDISGDWILDYGEKNTWRIASYHALDIGISGRRETKEWVLEYATGFTNIYNHENPLGARLYLDEGAFTVVQVNGFPCLPYLKFNLFIR